LVWQRTRRNSERFIKLTRVVVIFMKIEILKNLKRYRRQMDIDRVEMAWYNCPNTRKCCALAGGFA